MITSDVVMPQAMSDCHGSCSSCPQQHISWNALSNPLSSCTAQVVLVAVARSSCTAQPVHVAPLFGCTAQAVHVAVPLSSCTAQMFV